MKKETKHVRFLRIAQERKKTVLKSLQSLGNCSNPVSYDYEAGELLPIIQPIIEKLAEVWRRMSTHSPYSFEPFRLGEKSVLEINGLRCRCDQLASSEEVLELLRTNGANFTALASIREQYVEQFSNELCWSYPFCDGDYLGCVVLPVQEGILCLPYSSLDGDTYEQFVLESAGLLTREQLDELKRHLLTQAAELYNALSDMSRFLPDVSTRAGEEL